MTADHENIFDWADLGKSESQRSSKEKVNTSAETPANLGKAWNDCVVPDFNDLDRPKTCLEVDFPIAQINALSQLEGNAGKPIYQMSKWWARRRSSVFRSMLIAAATKCPDDPSEAAKVVWDHYYCNQQKACHDSNESSPLRCTERSSAYE